MARRRRGRSEGAVYQRDDGTWCASISLGYNEQGKRKRKVVYGQSKAEVQEKLRQLHNDVATGRADFDAQGLTLSEYLSEWLEGTAKPRVSPKTALRYEQLIRLRINPHLGGVKLAKLTPLHVQNFFTVLEKDG